MRINGKSNQKQSSNSDTSYMCSATSAGGPDFIDRWTTMNSGIIRNKSNTHLGHYR